MIKNIHILLTTTCLLLLSSVISNKLGAQTCAGLSMTIQVEQGAACNESGTGGSIKIILSDPDFDHSSIVFRVYVTGGDPRLSAVGGLIINDIRAENELNVISTEEIPCLNAKLTKKFDMPYGLHIDKDKSKTYGVHCFGSPTAQIQAVALGGTDNYTYQLWDGGTLKTYNTTGVFDYGEGGKTYTIKVKDNGCASAPVVSYDVTVKDYRSTLGLIQGTSSVCPGGKIELSIDLPGASYATWKDPKGESHGGLAFTQPDATPADSGIYTLSLTTREGCVYTETFLVSVSTPPPPIIPPLVVCEGSSTIALIDHVVKTNSSYSLIWYEQDGVTERATAPSVETNTAGVTTYFVAQKDTKCQTTPLARVEVTVNALPDPISPDKVSVFINPSNPLPELTVQTPIGYQYNLYTDATGGTLVGSTGRSAGTTVKVRNNTALSLNTTYYLSTISEKDCEALTRTPIAIGGSSTLIDGPTAVCLGTAFTLSLSTTISNATEIAWVKPNGATIVANTLTIAAATLSDKGRYQIRVRTPEGTMEDSIVLAVNQTAKPKVAPLALHYCQGDTAMALQATVDENHTIRWYKDNSPLGNTAPIPNTVTAGILTYRVLQLNDITKCESDLAAIQVEIHGRPLDVPAAKLSTCITNVPNVSIALSDATYQYSLYTSSTGGAQEVAPVKGNGGVIKLVGTSALSQAATYYVEVSNSNNCTANSRTPIKMIANTKLITGTAAVCDGGTIRLSAPSIVGASYGWTRPNGTEYQGNPLPDINNAKPSVDAGDYSISIELLGCTPATESFRVKVGRPDMPGGPEYFAYCQNSQSSPLTAEASPDFILRWYTQEVGGTASLAAPSPTTEVAGNMYYYVTQATPNDATCESDRRRLTVVINEHAEMVAPLAPLNICEGSIPQVEIRNSQAGYAYLLYPSAQYGSPLDSIEGTGGSIFLSANATLSTNVTYYVGTQTMATGCTSSARTEAQIVVTNLYLKPEKLPNFKRNEPYLLTLETNANSPLFTYTGPFPSNYFELNGLTGEISGTVPASGSAEPRTFTIQVEDPSGCTVAREYTLKSDLLITQVFSPNGDGINDVFMKGFHLVIFDKKGVRLFEGENGWDGSRNGAIMPPDTYYFIIHYTADDGSKKNSSGFIMLLTR